ncbi:MAG: hypothetical protein HXX16_09245 [Bacteroidales bacterium]|nr:hypothetical protein [Bacteroidales bacterium]
MEFKNFTGKIPVIGIILDWTVNIVIDLSFFLKRLLITILRYLGIINYRKKIEFALSNYSRRTLLNKSLPEILLEDYNNNIDEMYDDFYNIVYSNFFDIDSLKFNHIRIWFDEKRKGDGTIDFKQIITFHVIYLKHLGYKSPKIIDIYRFYCWSHGITPIKMYNDSTLYKKISRYFKEYEESKDFEPFSSFENLFNELKTNNEKCKEITSLICAEKLRMKDNKDRRKYKQLINN